MRTPRYGRRPYWPALLLLLLFVPGIISLNFIGEPEVRFFEHVVDKQGWRGFLVGFALGLSCTLAAACLCRAAWRSYQRGSRTSVVASVIGICILAELLFPFMPTKFSSSYDDATWRRVPWMAAGCPAGLFLVMTVLIVQLRRGGGIVLLGRADRGSTTTVIWRRRQ